MNQLQVAQALTETLDKLLIELRAQTLWLKDMDGQLSRIVELLTEEDEQNAVSEKL